MLLDRLTNLSYQQDLTGIAAGGTGYSSILDISSSRDIGVGDLPTNVLFNVAPTSTTAGATLNIAIQGSNDPTFPAATSRTMVETSPQLLTDFQNGTAFAFRGRLPKGYVYRYYRAAYTPSAALATGSVTTTFAAEAPRVPYYPKAYTV